MKRISFAVLLIFLSLSANAFDRWTDDRYKGGEIIFTAGIAQLIVIGSRGFGITINPNTEGHVISKEISVKIDDGPRQTFPIQHVAVTTYQVKCPDNLIDKVASATKVEISYNLCSGTANGCAFTYKGSPRTASWEFDSSLKNQYPNYVELIQRQ